MRYGRLLALSEELDALIVSLQTLYLDCVVGFTTLHCRLLEHQNTIRSVLGECEEASDNFQDACGVTYNELCGIEFSVESVSPVMNQGEVKQRTARNGTNYILMGRLCVVYAYAYWESHLRKEVGLALGLKNPPKHDFWGDMRIMRNAIVHNKGKAGPEFKKMKVLKWFAPGDDIDLGFDEMKEIFAQMALCRNCLHALSLPRDTAIFPSREFPGHET